MSYWISEIGDINRAPAGAKSFYCDFRTDIEKLPNNTDKGDLSAGDEASAQLCKYGSDCMCLEDTSLWILGKETNAWQEV